MLRYANALTGRARRRSALGNAWGVNLLEQSLATAWYPAKWDNVGDDELVFLIPSLCHWQGRAAADEPAQQGPVQYLSRLLASRADALASLMADKADDKQATSKRQARHSLATCGLTTSLPYDEGSNVTPLVTRARPPADRLEPQNHSEPQTWPSRGAAPDWLAGPLIGLAYTDRALADALGKPSTGETRDGPLIDWQLGLSDALVVSASTRINAAYVYPEFNHAHELLSLAAVLGHLADGRAAYLPPVLAEALLDCLPRRGVGSEAAFALHSLAEQAHGVTRLATLARIISATGVAQLIMPRPTRLPTYIRTNGSERLLQRVDASKLWPISRGV